MTTLAKEIAEKVREHAEKFSDEHNMTMHYTRPAMTALAEEVVKLSLAAHSAKLQRLVTALEAASQMADSWERSKKIVFDALQSKGIPSAGFASWDAKIAKIRAALADMKEVENERNT